jgi:hypothetical protein
VWVKALVDLRGGMPAAVFNQHLANAQVRCDNGVFHVIVPKRSAEWLNLPRLLNEITAAVRAVDASVERVEVGT